MKAWILFKCRKCGELLIAKSDQARKTCTKCNKSMALFVSKAVGGKYVNTIKGQVRQSIMKPTTVPRVKILKEFDTAAEAGDALRFAKLPSGKDPTRTELYQSTMWRKP